jgi:3-dehydroquinate synthase
MKRRHSVESAGMPYHAPLHIETFPYPVVVGAFLESEVAAFLKARSMERIVLLCDRRVEEHAYRYAEALPKGTPVLAFPLGERRKRLHTVEAVLDALAEAGADRRSTVGGVGGGVAGDLFGFAAASYMRGVPFVTIATSVVAMVDASVGGKTGVDLAAGKNLAGAFRDPIAVFAAIETLETLPTRQLREGLGEVVKHAILEGGAAFARLEALAPLALRDWPWEAIVAESIGIKAGLVLDDRLESGRRERLNLGHTFAHGLEYATDYRLSHGAAVSIGLRAAGLLALRRKMFSREEHLRLLSLLTLLKLPLHDEDFETEGVLEGMAADKKARNGRLRFVLPRAIGEVESGLTAPLSTVRAVVERLHTPP